MQIRGKAKASGFVLKPKLAFEDGKRYRWEFKGLFVSLVATAKLPAWVTPHVLRHTFASLAAQAGISLFKIGAWMGHSMTEVTEIYAHLAAYDADINKTAGQAQAAMPAVEAPAATRSAVSVLAPAVAPAAIPR